MQLNELFGFGKKKEAPKERPDFTEHERKLITSIFDRGHNANVKFADGRHVLPGNITVNYGRARINFYKWHDDTVHADVGYYHNDSDPGNPRKSPITTFDEVINMDNTRQLAKLRDRIDSLGGYESPDLTSTMDRHRLADSGLRR